MNKLITGSTLAGLLLVIALISTPLPVPGSGQDSAEQPTAQAAPATPLKDDEQGDEEDPLPADAETANTEAIPLEAFEPTEKIQADSAVAFPVDI